MNEKMEKAQDMLLEKVNKFCREFGLNNIMAQLYAILYFSKKPLSLDDMVERLKISKGSASVNIRVLERDDIVRRIWVKGSRKDYYEAEIDISKVMIERIKSMASRRIAEVDDMLNTINSILDSANTKDKEEREAIEEFRQRLSKLKSLHDRAKILLNLFNSGVMNGLLNGGLKQAERNISLASDVVEIAAKT